MEQLIQELNGDKEVLNENADVSIERLRELAGIPKLKIGDQIADVPKVKTMDQIADVPKVKSLDQLTDMPETESLKQILPSDRVPKSIDNELSDDDDETGSS